MKAEEIKVKVSLEKWFVEANKVFSEVLSKRVGGYVSERDAIQMAEEFALAMIQHAVKVEKPLYVDPYNHDVKIHTHTLNPETGWYEKGGEVPKPVKLDGKEIARVLNEECKRVSRERGVY